MRLSFSVLFALAVASHAQSPDRKGSVRAWFVDGAGLEIYSETTGSTNARAVSPVSPQGSIGIALDRVNRLVLNKDRTVLFGYILEARRSPASNGVSIRIEPLDSAARDNLPTHLRYPALPLPSVATVREFSPVKFGEVVTLDILFNPSTGEKVYDVIRPITDPSPSPAHPVVTAAPNREQLSLKEIAVRVNRRPVNAPVHG